MSSFADSHNVFVSILDELKKLNASQRGLQQQVLCFSRELVHIKSVIAIFQQSPDIGGTGSAPDQVDLQQPNVTVDPCWQCPVCGKVLQHKDSFRGHIRKLVHSSTRPKCHLNPCDVTHQAMVARFAGATFYEKAAAFCRELNSQVKWSCTKRDDDEQSWQHVLLWIAAAKSDVLDFPVYDARFRSSARKQRVDTEANSSPDSSVGALSTENTSSLSSSIDSFFSAIA
jgi:hypothetical protein